MESITKYLTLIGVIAGAMAALTATLLKADEKTLQSIYLLSSILIIVLFFFAKAHFNKITGQDVLLNFITNNLSPNRSRQYLEFNAKLVVVEDTKAERLNGNYKEHFKGVSDLTIVDFVCDSSDIELQKTRLGNALKGAEAILIVRTKELEENHVTKDGEEFFWIYEFILFWAKQNSHAPILVINKIASDEEKKLKFLSPIPERFFFIGDDRPSLPWRLMQRANERALLWRNLASFSRMVALCFLVLLLLGFVIGYFKYSSQRSEHEALLYKSYQRFFQAEAQRTKNEYVRSVMNGEDGGLNVSYWVSRSGTIYALTSTEDGEHKSWEVNKPSIISCGFFHRNSSVQWDEEMDNPSVSLHSGEKLSPDDKRCKYGLQGQRTLGSLVCITSNETEDPENTVGICVFTNKGHSYVSKKPIDFLQQRTREFNNFILPLLKDKKLIPQ